MGRYKLGPQGGYYDPNDSGPDQFTPTPGQQYPGMPAPQQEPQGQPQQSSGLPTTPGVNGQPVYTGGYDPNSPLYQRDGGGFGPGQNPWMGQHRSPMQVAGDYSQAVPGQNYIMSAGGGGQSPWMTLGSLGQGLDQSQKVYGDGMAPTGDLSGSKSIWSSLGSIGNTLGVNGGNVQPKTGMLGPIVNQFKR
jgi:hypothetical protein